MKAYLIYAIILGAIGWGMVGNVENMASERHAQIEQAISGE